MWSNLFYLAGGRLRERIDGQLMESVTGSLRGYGELEDLSEEAS